MKCKDCVHYDVCGEEGIDDPAMTFCGYFIDKADFAK